MNVTAKQDQLRQRYLELVNQELPKQSKQRNFPVTFNHCFARIILFLNLEIEAIAW